MNVLERMDRALAELAERWGGRRIPKAFYLVPDDWAEFTRLADLECTVTLPWGNNPPRMRTDPAYCDVPVRQSLGSAEGAASKLYDHASMAISLVHRPDRKPVLSPRPVPADQLADALDKLSRTRALTEHESIALEHALKGRVVISRREAIRLGVRL